MRRSCVQGLAGVDKLHHYSGLLRRDRDDKILGGVYHFVSLPSHLEYLLTSYISLV